jgi:class 3 adenylate cyclase
MYRAYLEQSQIFVGIYWQRYGWVGPGMEISGLEDEFRLAAGMPMLLYLKRPAPNQEPGLTAMINSIRSAGATSYRHFTTARELERLLVDDLAVLLSESFADATMSIGAPHPSRGQSGEPGGAELPVGTVTFLLTDIERSTRLWEAEPEAMEVALQQHDRLLLEVIEEHGGKVIASRGEGDSFFAVFPSAVSAVEAAGVCQLRLVGQAWPTGTALRVRMGLHTGEARVRGGDHVDHSPINRCARVRAAGHGGQVLLTKATRDLVAGHLGSGFGLKELGDFRLRDLAAPELIYQLIHADLPAEFPPIGTVAARTGNLPLQVSSFIGRARELDQITAALGEARVVILTGAGGVARPGWRCRPRDRCRRGFVTAPGCVNWARCATQLGWTMRLRRCFQSSPRPARAAATLWWSSCAVSSCYWCWTTVSICSKQRRRWPVYCSGHVSGS